MRQLPDEETGDLTLCPGDWGHDPRDGLWYAYPPALAGDKERYIVRIRPETHMVQEHPDGSITVMPSIFMRHRDEDVKPKWHGMLIAGEWQYCH